MRSIFSSMLLGLLFTASSFADSPPLDNAIKILQARPESKQASSVYVAALEVVRNQAKRGDAKAFDAVLGCVQADALASPVRAEALRVALQLSDNKQFSSLITTMDEIGKQVPVSSASKTTEAPAYYTGSSLMWVFLDSLPRPGTDTRPLFDLLRDWAVKDAAQWKFGWARDKALSAIVKTEASESLRRQYVLDIIAAAPNHQPVPQDARDLVNDDASRTALRKMFAKGLTDQRQFHYAAASVLAHQGETSILDGLKIRQKKEPAGFTQGLIDYYIWQIEAQNPPSKLLEILASVERRSAEATVWAVERASQLGLDKNSIRSALVKHCKQYGDPSEQSWMAQRPELVATAIKIGIITKDDTNVFPPANKMPPSPYGHLADHGKH